MATRDLVDYLELTCERGGSDLHLCVGAPPMARVHGVLHLIGFDHLDDSQAVEMEGLETLILHGLGFPPPYEDP